MDFYNYQKGDYVVDVLKDNIVVQAIGHGEAFTPDKSGLHNPAGGAARILDSSDPNPAFGLGAPNNNCGGPGVGQAGTVGLLSENCGFQGNVLIIQRRDKMAPDDVIGGGSFVFKVDESAKWRLKALGMLNIPKGDRVDLSTMRKDTGEITPSFFVGLGENAYQEFSVDGPIRWHTEFRIDFPAQGGLSWLKLCKPINQVAPARKLRQGQ